MQPPKDLRLRGSEFWDEVTGAVELDASGFILLGEACRIIDRLDRLSDSLNGAGRDWLKIADEVEDIVIESQDHRKVTIKVVVDGLLSEARQQQLAFKTVMAQMKLGNALEKRTAEKSALQQWLESRNSG